MANVPMKKKPAGKQIVNVGVSALARETGLSLATISTKMKAGKTADEIRAEAARKQGNRILPTKRRVPAKPTPSEYEMIVESRARYEELEHWKLRKAKALAERQELENMLRRGELMPLSYVRTWANRFLIDGKDELLKGPSELADAVAAESDPLKAKIILQAWVDRVIAKYYQLDRMWGKGSEQDYAGIAS